MFGKSSVYVDSPAAWRAPIAAFIAQLLLSGFGQASGLILIALHVDFGVPKAYLLPTAVVGFGLEMMLAPFIERFCAMFGAKVSLLVSTIIAFLVMMVMSWVPISGFVTLGVLGVGMGIARSFASFPTYSLATLAFRKHRGISSSFMRNGVTIGAVFYPIVLVPALDFYGTRITIFLLGAFFLNMLIATILLPIRIIDPDTGRLITSPPKCSCTGGLNATNSSVEIKRADKTPIKVTKIYLISFMMILILLMVSLVQVCHIYPLFADENGHSTALIAMSISIRNGCDMLGRGLYGFINDRLNNAGRLILVSAWLSMGGLGTLLLLFEAGSPLTVTILFSVAMGLSNGIFTASWMPLLVDFAGESLFPKVMAIVMLILGALMVAGTFVVGEIVKLLDSHRLVGLVFTAGILVSALAFICQGVLFKKCRRDDDDEEEVCIELQTK